MVFREGPPLQMYYPRIGKSSGTVVYEGFPSAMEKEPKEMGAFGDDALRSHVIIPQELDTDDSRGLPIIPNSSGLDTRVFWEGRQFKVSPLLKKWLNRHCYTPEGSKGSRAVRVFNKGQFGDTAGSYYLIEELGVIAYNRIDNKLILGSAYRKTPPNLPPIERLVKAFEAASLVCEDFEIPFLRYKNKENEIWYLPSIQRLFTSDFAPIVIPPRQLFPITQVRLYERYAKNSSGISIRTRAILSQIEAETRSQHEVKRVDDFVSEIAFFDSK